jgi:hypothetical protein
MEAEKNRRKSNLWLDLGKRILAGLRIGLAPNFPQVSPRI